MNNWKIIVYTIMKNEKHNIDEWLENIKDADGIYVLDTGSTDGSYEYMLEKKDFYPQLQVLKKEYDNFQFDIARNDNLSMVPSEDNIICWTIDLDERFISNWYQLTKETADEHPDFYKLTYWYACRHNDFGEVEDKHIYDKCHRRIGAKWSRPIHEILDYDHSRYSGLYSLGDEIVVHHYQNEHDRRGAQYINLLKQRIKEDKYDIEAFHHLTTEYGKLGDLQSQIDLMLLQYGRGLMCNCDWMECICGNLAETFFELNNFDQAKFWFNNAINYNPQLKTYYIKYLKFLLDIDCLEEAEKFYNKKYLTANFYQQEEWKEINDDFCNSVLGKLFDMLALKYYYSNEYDFAHYFGQIAVEKLPFDRRLTQNLYYYEQKLSIKNAYVTVLSDNSFINGVIALNRSLKEVESIYPLYCIVTKEVSVENIAVLTALGIKILEKNPDYYSNNHKEMIDIIETLDTYGWHKAMVKLELFNLTEFNNVVYLDSDMIVFENIDHLFTKPHMSAARDCCSMEGYFGDGQTFNSGLMVIEPNSVEYNSIISSLNNFDSSQELIHDQLILQRYFDKWPNENQILSPEYNYWSTYPEKTSGIKIMHFVDKKPWRMNKEYFENFSEEYPFYSKMSLQYIDYINDTIRQLKENNICSKDLKIIE